MGGMGGGTPARVARGLASVVAGSLLAVGAGGCGSASEPSPPAGVDRLAIPTPSLDPGDFVEGVDNPFLPLEPASTWSYRLTGVQTGTVTVTVAEQTRTVAGLAATVVESSWPDRRTADFYAQDRAGNVWWLGREGVWEAGVDRAMAGLAMAATPRFGDGYRLALLDGVVEDRARVSSVAAETAVPAGSYEGCVEVETESPLTPGVVLRHTYAEGVGLVRTASLEGPVVTLELVSGP